MSCGVTHRGELVLQAALLKDQRAAAAWQPLRSQLDLNRLTLDEHRLLPLLYRNLSSMGVRDERLVQLKGIYLHSWSRNVLILKVMARVLRQLQAAGIPTLALKGAALIATYYEDPGVRPMSDFDVLVPVSARALALDVLERDGWIEPDGRTKEYRLAYYHAIDLQGPEPFGCDLHWQLMHYLTLPGDAEHSADDFWFAAQEIEILGVPTQALCPADQVLHVCAHGARWDSGTTLCWVADAATVLAVSGERFDWARLVSQARRRRSVLVLRTALDSMAALGVDVPSGVRRQLAALPVGRREALSATPFVRRAQGPGARLSWMALDQLETYARLTANWRLRRTVTSFPSFLRNRLYLEHSWQMSALLARRARRAWADRRPADSR